MEVCEIRGWSGSWVRVDRGLDGGRGFRSKNISALITLKSPGGRGPRFEGPGKNRGNTKAY